MYSPTSVSIFKPSEGKVVQLLGNTLTQKSDSNEQGWRFFEVVSSAGSRTPLHTHPWNEGFYVLAGEMDVYIEDQIISATTGYCIHIPAGVIHGSEVKSSQVKLLNWVPDNRAEVYIQELAQVTQPTSEQVMAIQKKHQISSAKLMNTGIIVHDASPEKQLNSSWLSRAWKYLMHHLLKGHEPRIWQKRGINGEVFYNGYDPYSGKSTHFATETEMRNWLDRLPYS